jgi:hypothetical protein
MQTIAPFLAATAFIAGIALANAQSTSPRSLDSRTPPGSAADAELNRRAVDAERNPDRTIGDYKTPRNNVGGFTTGAGSTGSPSSADNPGMRRNPDGSFGGTPENPHPR